MAYTEQTWSDRIVQNPLTYTLQTNADGTTTLIPAEGTITQNGTPITADALNHMEAGIANALPMDTGGTIAGNVTASADLTVGGHLHVGGAGHDILFDAGRTNTSNIFWNANSGADYGLSINVDGQSVVTFYSDGSMYGAKNPFAIKALQDISLNSGTSAGWIYINANSGRVYLKQDDGAGVYVTNVAQNAFMPINASAFNVNSAIEYKKNIKDYANTAESLINAHKIVQFNYKNENDNSPQHIGVIQQDSHDDVVAKNGEGISIYAMTSIAWKAIQELSAKVQDLTVQVQTLKNNAGGNKPTTGGGNSPVTSGPTA